MAKKKPTLSRTKADDDVIYDEADDEQDEKEWVEEPAPAPAAGAVPTDPAALVGTNQEVNPDEPVYGTPEETRDLPEPASSEAPVRPEDEEPPPYGSDLSPNQAFNVKAGSMPEDRPDHDKPLGEKGKDPAYGYDVEDKSPKDKRKEK